MTLWAWFLGLFKKKLTLKVIVSPLSGPRGTVFTITESASGGKAPYTYALSQIGGIQPTQVKSETFTVVL